MSVVPVFIIMLLALVAVADALRPFGFVLWQLRPVSISERKAKSFEPSFKGPAIGHFLSKRGTSSSDPGSEKSPRLNKQSAVGYMVV